MAFSSLADELAGAFDDEPLLNPDDELGGNGHVQQSLADEFGLEYEVGLGDDKNQINADDDGLIFGKEINGIDNDIQHNPSTPPLEGHLDLPNLQTPVNSMNNGDKGRTRKVPYSPTNLDDTSPNRGIDLDLDLEMELGMDLREGHSFSPHHLDDEFAHEDDMLDSPSRPRIIERGIRNKSSNKSLRSKFSLSKFPSSLYNHNHNHEHRDNGTQAQDDSLIILSECLASSSKLLTTLRGLNGNDYNHQHGQTTTGTVTIGQKGIKQDKEKESNYMSSDEILENKLQNHLNTMIGVEKEKDHWIRDLNILLLESGFSLDNDLHDVDVRHNIVDVNHNLTDLKEEEEEQDEPWNGGWAGESYLTENQSPAFIKDNVKKDVIQSHEINDRDLQHDAIHGEDLLEEHVDPHDALLLDDYSPNYESSITPTTSLSTIASPFHQSQSHDIQSPQSQTRAQEPYLPGLLRTIIKETQIIILKLGDLNDKLHTYSSFNTSYSRQIKNIKSSLESFREREKVELEARKRIEVWEESRLKMGLTRNRNTNTNMNSSSNENLNARNNDDDKDKDNDNDNEIETREERDEDCLTIQEKLSKECRGFEMILNDYGRKLENLNMNTRILSAR